MQGKTITITADSPEDAIRLIEVMSADLERLTQTLSTCCQDVRAVFGPLVLDFNSQLAAGYRRALRSAAIGGAA